MFHGYSNEEKKMEAFTSEARLKLYFDYLGENSNVKSLTTNADNNKVPVHRWFPFLAGYSHKFVEETIKYFSVNCGENTVFDPFMGSGTTGVAAKDLGVNIIGNESNFFLYNICNIKLNSNIDGNKVIDYGLMILEKARLIYTDIDIAFENVTVKKCYSESNLRKLVALRHILSSEKQIPNDYRDILFLAITMSLSKTSKIKINAPYVCWCHKQNPEDAFLQFQNCIQIICFDLNIKKNRYKSEVKVYLHDSRVRNNEIESNSIDMIFTSPPYLNNLDYGETLKVFLYFWEATTDSGQITESIRNKAVVSSTTYYPGKCFLKTPEEILGDYFIEKMSNVADEIIEKMVLLSVQKKSRSGKKSYNVMTGLYFKDMLSVIEEMYRVLKTESFAFIIIGDSAPYGVHIPTDTILGEMALKVGFSSYTLKPLRTRGSKWKSLQHRHSLNLRESLLVLRR